MPFVIKSRYKNFTTAVEYPCTHGLSGPLSRGAKRNQTAGTVFIYITINKQTRKKENEE